MVIVFIVFIVIMMYLIYNPQIIKSLIQKLIFFPPPVSINIDKTNMKTIKSKNGNKITYFTYNIKENKNNKVIIWSHGNAMNAYYLQNYFEKLSSQLDIDIISYDYQGYGFSEGTPTEEACYEDLYSVIEIMKKKYEKIYLIGHSIGTGIVAHHASVNNWKYPIMLISPYKSIISIITDKISNNIRDLLYIFDVFSTVDKIKNARCKIKIIHGLNDNLISSSHSKELYEMLNDKVTKPIFIKDTSHNDILEKINIEIFEEFINL
jgi:pimeloyl-ACP methyl ester carboxylesterase